MISLPSLATIPLVLGALFPDTITQASTVSGQSIGTANGISDVWTANTNTEFPVAFKEEPPTFWFSFGDSYTETGFSASGTLPSIGNPLGNPPYPGYTAVGGENWVDILTTAYNKSLVLTYNFAKGGATIDSKFVTPGQGVSLTDEVNTFLHFSGMPKPTPWDAQNTLFSFWIGINDIGYSYDLGGNRDAFSDTLLDAYFVLVENRAGARNYLFINVPPMERSPHFLSLPKLNQTAEKNVIDGFNCKLQTRINWFDGNHSDISLWQWDAHAAFSDILDHPCYYGFKDSTSYGSNNPKYFWSGKYHPSSAAHWIFAGKIQEVLWNS
ncbi:hypothetical protein APHAL10511_003545 [Amanita phalloides]|nr:hypothetical protein APHAL10511_003545 [Amanita phalloides]